MSEQSRFTHHADGVVFEPGRDLYWTANDVTDERVTHEDALAAIAKLNEQAFGGFTDWRMPEVEELFLLADRSRYKPAIDTEFFPDTKNDWYWTSTITAWSPGHAWIVHFSSGGAHDYHRDYSLAVARAVRSVPAGQ